MSEPLLQGLADTARAVFGARAASVMTHDGEADELVFAAVSGEGADTLPGRRIPAMAGISGWVFSTGEPVVLEDVTADARFAASFAQSTGYIPKGIMAAPILGNDGPIGVISVLDRPRRVEFSLVEVELLERFCHLIGLALMTPQAGPAVGAPVSELATAVAALPARRRAAAERLLDALTGLLES
jgi:GAF domain-containing protein